MFRIWNKWLFTEMEHKKMFGHNVLPLTLLQYVGILCWHKKILSIQPFCNITRQGYINKQGYLAYFTYYSSLIEDLNLLPNVHFQRAHSFFVSSWNVSCMKKEMIIWEYCFLFKYFIFQDYLEYIKQNYAYVLFVSHVFSFLTLPKSSLRFDVYLGA